MDVFLGSKDFNTANNDLSSILEWKLGGAFSGSDPFNIPVCKELKVLVYCTTEWWAEITIPYNLLNHDLQYFQTGADNGIQANIYATINEIYLGSIFYNGEKDTTHYGMWVYYR